MGGWSSEGSMYKSFFFYHFLFVFRAAIHHSRSSKIHLSEVGGDEGLQGTTKPVPPPLPPPNQYHHHYHHHYHYHHHHQRHYYHQHKPSPSTPLYSLTSTLTTRQHIYNSFSFFPFRVSVSFPFTRSPVHPSSPHPRSAVGVFSSRHGNSH